jgi:DNA-binding response OmpR family regulator
MTFSEGTAVEHAPDDYLPKPFEPREWPGLSTLMRISRPLKSRAQLRANERSRATACHVWMLSHY